MELIKKVLALFHEVEVPQLEERLGKKHHEDMVALEERLGKKHNEDMGALVERLKKTEMRIQQMKDLVNSW